MLWLRRYILDKGYIKFLNGLLELHPTPTSLQYPAHPALIPDWTDRPELGGVDVLAAPTEGATSAKENMCLIVVQFVTRVLLATLVRFENKGPMKEWVLLLRRKLNDSAVGCVWFCRYLADHPVVVRACAPARACARACVLRRCAA